MLGLLFLRQGESFESHEKEIKLQVEALVGQLNGAQLQVGGLIDHLWEEPGQHPRFL